MRQSQDEDWVRIGPLLPGQPGQPGVNAKDNRLFLNAVFWIAKTGVPWRDLPKRFGKFWQLEQRLAAIRSLGQEGRLAAGLRGVTMEWLLFDSTVVRAHPHTSGAKEGPQDQDQTLGRSRGGFFTKIHIATDGLGNPPRFLLSGGQESDITSAESLIDGQHFDAGIGDKGYDSDRLVKVVESQGAEAMILPTTRLNVAAKVTLASPSMILKINPTIAPPPAFRSNAFGR